MLSKQRRFKKNALRGMLSFSVPQLAGVALSHSTPPSNSQVALASSFVAPLPIPGIRRAPRTPTLSTDSKFNTYVRVVLTLARAWEGALLLRVV
ncbi:hypothetical protein cyc_00793 [Cyclospora cayetanensis]|uniref:Uncharacterized protein n=1 Tax=Cyclospora cayetanensis TaxID=88456 RepID=A0A1D3D883_9EIME|nr:hypothetical protein cyc_00793 [Cyclospora cayetanensis]